MNQFPLHYENSVFVSATPDAVFNFANDPNNFSSHMNESSWMMAGSSMKTETDDKGGKELGSHIKMSGKILGIDLFLDEVITILESPFRKEWETVGEIKLVVIGHYRLGFEITPQDSGSKLRVYIDYELPRTLGQSLLGICLGKFYAKWCVKQMTKAVYDHLGVR